jgi:hypothetical protein
LADQVVIQGVRPYDGSYELDLDGQPLTTREWGYIKRHAGYLPLTLDENTFADPEFVAVLAVIAVRRAGTIEEREITGLLDRLFDAPFGATVTIETDGADLDEEGDADGPPAGSSDSRPSSNGADSTTASDSSENPPKPTGPRRSDTSGSAPAMSVT